MELTTENKSKMSRDLSINDK
jgi:hypothetical protein